jgi:hypothetical protein
MEHVEQEVVLAYRTRSIATNERIVSAHLQAQVCVRGERMARRALNGGMCGNCPSRLMGRA